MRQHKQRGFNVIELIVAMGIVGISVAIAVPSFLEMIRNNRVSGAATSLVTAFNLARSEALKLSLPVTVCASNNGANCTGAGTWVNGWIVFQDGSGVRGQLDGADVLLQAYPAIGGDIVLNTVSPFVQYQSTGTALAGLTADLFWVGCGGEKLRQLSISIAGTVQTRRQMCP